MARTRSTPRRLRPTSRTIIILAAVATVVALLVFWFIPEEEFTARRVEGLCGNDAAAQRLQLSDTDCTEIASQIPVLPRKTDPDARVSAFYPTSNLKPGDPVPAEATELKPLPPAATAKYRNLTGFHYFLAGQNIVLVDNDQRIAMTIDVRVRPDRPGIRQ